MSPDEQAELVAENARLRATVYKVRAENKELRRLAKTASGMSRNDLKAIGDMAWYGSSSQR